MKKTKKDSQTRHLFREKDGRQLSVSSNGSKGEGRLRDGDVDEKKRQMKTSQKLTLFP